MGGNPSRVRLNGPLETVGVGFAAELAQLGYKKNSTADQLRLMAHLSRWLAAERLDVAELTPSVTDAFLAERRGAGYTLWLSQKALAPLLQYLRRLGALPPVPGVVPSPTEALLGRYRDYLISERGLTNSTALGYIHLVRPLVRMRERPDGELELESLAAKDITGFMLTDVTGRGSAKLAVTSLRSFLGFLHVDGVIAHSLSATVPSVAGYKLAGLPKAIEPGHVQQLLASCDQSTAVGRRDYAILTMLVRLGLRAGEIAAWTWATSTGEAESSVCAARVTVASAFRCQSMSGVPSQPT